MADDALRIVMRGEDKEDRTALRLSIFQYWFARSAV